MIRSRAVAGQCGEFNAHNETLAGFGQVKFNPTPRFSLTLGGRYNYDRNDQTISYPNIDPVHLGRSPSPPPARRRPPISAMA
jgi:iron complex outermembrane receptor protein